MLTTIPPPRPKGTDELPLNMLLAAKLPHKGAISFCLTLISAAGVRFEPLPYLDVEHLGSRDLEAADGNVGKGRVPEPGLLDVDGLQLHRVHDVDADEVEQLNVVEVKLQILSILAQKLF